MSSSRKSLIWSYSDFGQESSCAIIFIFNQRLRVIFDVPASLFFSLSNSAASKAFNFTRNGHSLFKYGPPQVKIPPNFPFYFGKEDPPCLIFPPSSYFSASCPFPFLFQSSTLSLCLVRRIPWFVTLIEVSQLLCYHYGRIESLNIPSP